MRHLLVLALALAMLVGCGGAKKPAATPGSSAPAADSANESDKEEDINTPTDPDDPAAKSADPCEGGE